MALRISTSKNHRITSKMLNDRVNDVMGGSALISGFNINKESESVLSSGPGKCIINGAIIEGSLTGKFAFDEVMNARTQTKILIRYNHEEATVTGHIRWIEYELASNELLLATVKRENNVITEIIQEPYTVTLSELTRITNELEDAIESPITNVSGRDIKVGNSDYGKIENISIKGQTYHNLITDENIEKTITGTLATDSLCSHKIENTKAGLVDTVISGRTLQNLFDPSIISADNTFSCTDGLMKLTLSIATGTGEFFKFKKPQVKDNTIYTMILDIQKNTLTKSIRLLRQESYGVSYLLPASTTGIVKIKFMTNSANTTDWNGETENFYNINNAIGELWLKRMILEGDWTNVPIEEIPYIDGIKSAGEAENNIVKVKSCGKNLFDKNNTIQGFVSSVDGGIATPDCFNRTSDYIPIKPGTSYCFSSTTTRVLAETNKNAWVAIAFYDNNKKFLSRPSKISSDDPVGTVTPLSLITTSPINAYYARVGGRNMEAEYTAMFEEAPSPTQYEAYKESVTAHTLTEPLRSLPSGVCDEIVGNKLIRRVKKITFNGTEAWNLNGTFIPSGNSQFVLRLNNEYPLPVNVKTNSDIYCNNKPSIPWNSALSSFWIYDRSSFVIQFPTTEISTPGLLKAWLAANPTTVYYELATPVIEELTADTQLSTFPGVTYIASSNLLMPKAKVNSKGTPYNVPLLKPDTKYTVKWKENNSLDNIAVNLGGTSANSINTSSNNQVTLTTPIILENSNLYLSGFGNKVKDVIVVESENDEPNYFKGITSVGDINTPTLPNGVHDELIGNDKVIKRIEKVIFDGSENWVLATTQINGTVNVYIDKLSVNAKYPIPSFISYNIPSTKDYATSNDTSITLLKPLALGDLRICIRIRNDELETFNVAGVKKWLSKNPVTLWYELEIPIIKDSTDNYYISLKSRGSNLIKESNALIPHASYLKADYIDNKIVLDNSNDISKRSVYVTPVYLEKGKEYIFSIHNTDVVNGTVQPEFVIGQFRDSTPPIQIFKNEKPSIWVNQTGIYYGRVATPYGSLCKVKLNIQLEEGNKEKPYVPYKESIISYALTQPLRSLPNGVCDEIIGNKVIRRIGKIILDGSENWNLRNNSNSGISTFSVNTNQGLSNFIFAYNNRTSLGKKILICDKFITIETVGAVTKVEADSRICMTVIDNGNSGAYGIYVNIEQSKLTANSEAGFKAWLAANPVTVYYESLEPIEEELPVRLQTLESYDNTTYISSISNLSPTILADIITNLTKTINQNSSRLSILEDLIDGVIIPGLVDTDYRNVIFGFNYNF